jgi:hypothetical protein
MPLFSIDYVISVPLIGVVTDVRWLCKVRSRCIDPECISRSGMATMDVSDTLLHAQACL